MYVTEYTEKIMKYTCNDNDDIVQNASEEVNQIPNDIRISHLIYKWKSKLKISCI